MRVGNRRRAASADFRGYACRRAFGNVSSCIRIPSRLAFAVCCRRHVVYIFASAYVAAQRFGFGCVRSCGRVHRWRGKERSAWRCRPVQSLSLGCSPSCQRRLLSHGFSLPPRQLRFPASRFQRFGGAVSLLTAARPNPSLQGTLRDKAAQRRLAVLQGLPQKAQLP